MTPGRPIQAQKPEPQMIQHTTVDQAAKRHKMQLAGAAALWLLAVVCAYFGGKTGQLAALGAALALGGGAFAVSPAGSGFLPALLLAMGGASLYGAGDMGMSIGGFMACADRAMQGLGLGALCAVGAVAVAAPEGESHVRTGGAAVCFIVMALCVYAFALPSELSLSAVSDFTARPERAFYGIATCIACLILLLMIAKSSVDQFAKALGSLILVAGGAAAIFAAGAFEYKVPPPPPEEPAKIEKAEAPKEKKGPKLIELDYQDGRRVEKPKPKPKPKPKLKPKKPVKKSYTWREAVELPLLGFRDRLAQSHVLLPLGLLLSLAGLAILGSSKHPAQSIDDL